MLAGAVPGRTGQREQEIENRFREHRDSEHESCQQERQRRVPLADEALDRDHDPLGAAGRREAGAQDRGHRNHDSDVEGRLAETLRDPLAGRRERRIAIRREERHDESRDDQDQKRVQLQGEHAADHHHECDDEDAERSHDDIALGRTRCEWRTRAYNARHLSATKTRRSSHGQAGAV